MKTDVYTLAHEVKNPLCVAKGYMEMLNKNNFLKYKGIIEEELNNSIAILDSYLEYNKLTVTREIMDINVLLTEIINTMSRYLKNKKVNLRMNLIDDDIYMYADYVKLKQVFNNIIKNAYEAQAKNIWIDYEVLEDKIKIMIKNDGFKLKTREFSLLGTNYTTKVMGNGIGLNLAKKIIELHNGTINFHNTDNGVCVDITLLLA